MFGGALRFVREQAVFLIILLALTAAFVYVASQPSHPVRGTLAIAGTALLAAVLRLVLPAMAVGMLAVRSRWIDTAAYALLGGLIVVTDIRLRH